MNFLMKKYCASFFALLAIALGAWLVFYSAVQDVADSGFTAFYDFTEPVRLYLPMFLFVVSVWAYSRIRRSMDKEKILALEDEVEALAQINSDLECKLAVATATK